MPHSDAIDYLLGLPQYANVADEARKPGVERIESLMEAMNDPHEAIRTVHVAGTNGKGSVASMLAAISTAAGLRTGLHTSPHLTTVEERLKIDGTPAPTTWLADRVDQYRGLFERVQPSFFEVTVALTFLYFAERQVDLAVIEVGLGGRLDATNILHPALSIITNIDLDHTELLGNTLDAVAREKAGIIKPKTPVLSGVTKDEARAAIAEVADERNAPLHELRDQVVWRAPHADLTGSVLDVETPLRSYDRLRVALPGRHQQANAALALRAAEIVVPAVQTSADPVHEGLKEVRALTGFRGRLEVLQTEPLIVVDVAHNPPGIAATLETVAPVVADRGGTLHVCLNAVRGKGLPDVARLLAERQARVTPIPIDTKRAIPPDEIAETLRAHGVLVNEPCPLPEALARFQRSALPADGLLLTGSHKLVDILPDDLTVPSA